MKYTPVVVIALALVGGIICAGCISTQAVTQPSPNGSWMLGTNNNITLTINGTHISGFSGVNNYFGSANISTDGKFTTGNLGMTMMAGPAELEAAEKAFHETLNAVTSYKITDGTLILMDKNGKTLLTFVKAPVDVLSGTSWTTSDGQTVAFGTDGKIYGNGGVNTYNAVFTLNGENGVVFGAVASTKMAGPADLMNKETAFFAALGNVSGYTITDGKLILTDKDGKTLLTFAKAVSLAGTSWKGADNTTIVFETDGKYNGKAPVNSYFGSYTTEGKTLSLGAAASTLMAGTPSEMEKETAFFTALSNVAGFAMTDSTLSLTDAAGKVLLTFTSA
ncbi:MAG: META domain-containing protein [Methanocorpusculum sp.]|nr:META domain-containing protein [Methanocorpusculum sp.]